ncbi:conserved hypothetical protein [Talaromyces stipitatus ATCC 10500]|uniref:Uncharacterized protein n=1 Tax=Talaromyces stipitatus (strain ATCC 10500 / CBS 375.48 / QM 6759 / NRRL 1006) TaxID=441959 RepID=B8MF91_TALSN|nr:uncharacterized protein TSTA_012970 [Talaromyces stipitatus ATCC 10500]EED16190.1 conserved hypothetical protein [Talaromyces stipitatus ATCC 10500]
MDLLSAIIDCIRGPQYIETHSEEDIAEKVVHIISTTEKRGLALQAQIKDTLVSTEGWTESLAKAILVKLQQVIEKGQRSEMGAVLQEAVDSTSRVIDEIFRFATDHPVAATVFCTLVAIGILVAVSPWLIEVLGFGELGPVEGSFAAQWQSLYRGYVSKDSLFAFFQRLGMVWH